MKWLYKIELNTAECDHLLIVLSSSTAAYIKLLGYSKIMLHQRRL